MRNKGTKRITVDLEIEIYKEFKRILIDKDMIIRDFLIEAIEKELKKRSRKHERENNGIGNIDKAA